MNTIEQPALPSPRSQLLYRVGAASVALYGLFMLAERALGLQHVGLLVLAWACVSPKETPRRFVRDWWPMILFWMSYDVMRVFAPAIFPRVAVEAPLGWERALFLSPEGIIWPFHFARWEAGATGILPALLSGYCSLVYLTHLFAIPVILFLFWIKGANRLFRRMLWSFTALHVMSLAIYIAYPAAPPWWVFENGLAQPTVAHSMPMGFTGNSTLSALFHYSANRFAAIPSLHSAYPAMLTIVLALEGVRGRWVLLGAFYAASMMFACVFLNQHYIIDLLIGAALTPIAAAATWKLRMPDSDL